MCSYIPSRVVTIRKSLAWLNANIRLLRKRDYFHRLVKTTNSETIRRKYCHFRNMVVSAVRKAKYSFLMSISSLIQSPKQFWYVFHSLMPNHECTHTLTNGSISAESPTANANLLNSYFSNCFTIPPSQTSTPVPPTPLSSYSD